MANNGKIAFQPLGKMAIVNTATGLLSSGALRFFLDIWRKLDIGVLLAEERTTTTDATPKTIRRFAIAASTTTVIEAVIAARRTGGTAGTAEDGAAYRIAAAYNNIGGTATIIGAVNNAYTMESQAGWNVSFVPSGAFVSLQVTGAVGNNIDWHMAAAVYKS